MSPRPMMLVSLKAQGFGEKAVAFEKSGIALLKAREYALASTAKLIRNQLKDQARGRGASSWEENPLGWPALSPFTGTISAAHGARKGAFLFAQGFTRRMGWRATQAEVWADKINKDLGTGSVMSRSMSAAMRRQLRIGKRADKGRGRYDTIGNRFSRWTANQSNRAHNRLKVNISKRGQPLAKLLGFVRSRLDVQAGNVTVGFYRNQGGGSPDANLERMVEQQARGFATTITAKMRRFLFAIGAPIVGNTMVTPARPWFRPVRDRFRQDWTKHFQEKFLGRFLPTFRRTGYQLIEEAA